MENSYVEYRDTTGVESDSDTEIIDNSYTDESFAKLKTPGKKNHTAFVPESDDTVSEDDDVSKINLSKSVQSRSSVNRHVVLSSDDEKSKRGSIQKQSDASNNIVLSSSEDEAEDSPEIKPRRRPKTSPRLSESFIGRKTKKRIFLIDSDTENSIIVEHDNNRKLKCVKDTPAKIDKNDLRKSILDIKNMSIQSNDSVRTDDGDGTDDEQISGDEKTEGRDGTDQDEGSHSDSVHSNDDQNIEHSRQRVSDSGHSDDNTDLQDTETRRDISSRGDDLDESDGNDKNEGYSSDDGPDEDQLVMSRATRMSIMGILPKENDSDDSDYLQSDDTNQTSRGSSLDLPTDPPAGNETPKKDGDTSRLTCSPFQSPLHDITNEVNSPNNSKNTPDICDLTRSEPCDLRNRVLDKLNSTQTKYVEKVIDDDVTIIDAKPEVIALSSDEDEVRDEKKSPNTKGNLKAEPTSVRKDNTIKQYLLPPSYPNQVVYVKKNVRENELSKLNGLKEDLQNIRYLLENMDMNSLPDGGLKLIERLTTLEAEVRKQGDKVANMVIEPDEPTRADVARDGFDKENKGLSWDDIQKASNAVQPRMFGKQAMATHMAERNLILERLRDLYESLASRPSEQHHHHQPAPLVTSLMDHQLHALAWLHWRETQKPRGGILADDMGLGKTITMIALVVSDKEKNIDHQPDDDDHGGRSRLARGGTLVVCPASLMQQWAGEVAKHCRPHAVSVCHHHGAARATQPHRLASYDLVITTYNILQRESEKGGVLTRVRWRRVILDEAHVVRNHKSSTSLGVCSLSSWARWALTGTPLHNKDLDLFALLKFLKCTPFDDLAMWKKWIDNKSLGGQERLSTIMRCIMLRRTKQLLQERGQLTCLPERSAHHVDVTLHKDEMNVYQKVLVFSKTLFAQFLQQRAERIGDSAPGKDSEYHKMHKKMIALQGAKPVKSHEILVLLLRLRQVCCHCGLIAAMLDPDDTADVVEDQGGADLMEELNKLSLEDSRSKRKIFSSYTDLDFKIIERKNCRFSFPSEKAVVVSQWTSVLRLVERALTALGVSSVTLSGAVPVTARAALVNAVNDAKSDVKVMLLSLCAGGVGLNLCGANHLLLLDPHWNPQLEEQAQDRIYRVGQTKHVHIYRFMCVGTVEQTIRQLQDVKLKMADSVLTGARNTNASKLTIEDLKMLFNMGPQSDS
ncbi:Transcription termination factor 2 [Danaus plexippus plexippus]|uniref:Transcription termination factor 2 n=1 Tax=Danaus plexippus plexippus TaxID=278856 RepID=A0A212EV30_DANPL|nr:Transcription termination factor 2 [Danaus plexippus plexippus]